MQDKDIVLFTKVVVGLFLFLLVVCFFPFTIIGAGERSVVTRLGVINRVLDPGIHWVTPIIERHTDYSIRTQKEVVKASAASKDLQDVTAEVALNYNVNPANVSKMYVAVKNDYNTILIDPSLQEAIKASTALYTAEELITKREKVTQEILTVVKKGLLERSGGAELITPVSIAITDFKFSDNFSAAIEMKVKATQDALTAQNNLQKVKYEQEAVILAAKAQAESIRIQVESINTAGGENYVQMKIAERWDGHLPTTMVPGASIPLLNIK